MEPDDLKSHLPVTGSVVIRYEEGQVISMQMLKPEDHIATLKGFIELAKSAGYTVVAPQESRI
ncbi:hypothetical protein [Edaphovirga cremea]|uniref:hypothetical protein n=1 Tax=Edaphovirga cremea TaxID=2267246 RepID=UPI000DF00F73|nr:hypothetical protein [Edaphovirga cremea]